MAKALTRATKAPTSEPLESQLQKEYLIQKMKETGFRITKQRMILINILAENHCSSCKEMYYQASRVDHKIGIATVYRMINALEQIGVFDRKNLFKVPCKDNTMTDIVFVITLENGTSFEITAQQWDKVIRAGLHAYGYIQKEKIRSIRKKNKGVFRNN